MMLNYYIQEDEQFLIAVYSVHNDPEYNIDSIQRLSGWSFDYTKSYIFDDIGDFGNDTLIIHKGVINDIEIYDILEDGINVHIVS